MSITPATLRRVDVSGGEALRLPVVRTPAWASAIQLTAIWARMGAMVFMKGWVRCAVDRPVRPRHRPGEATAR